MVVTSLPVQKWANSNYMSPNLTGRLVYSKSLTSQVLLVMSQSVFFYAPSSLCEVTPEQSNNFFFP